MGQLSSRHNEDPSQPGPTPHLPSTGTERRGPHTGQLPPLLIQMPEQTTCSLRLVSGTNACRPGQPLQNGGRESKHGNRNALGEHSSILSTPLSTTPSKKPQRQLTFSGEHANCTRFPQTMQRQKTGERERGRERRKRVRVNTHIPCPHKRTDRVWQIIYIYIYTHRHIYMYTCHNVLEKDHHGQEKERKKRMAENGTQELRFLFVVMLVSQRAAAAAAYPPTPRRENDDCTKSPQSMLATIHIAHQHSVYLTIVVVVVVVT